MSQFNSLKETIRHFSLIPAGGGGILTHAVARVASSIKVNVTSGFLLINKQFYIDVPEILCAFTGSESSGEAPSNAIYFTSIVQFQVQAICLTTFDL